MAEGQLKRLRRLNRVLGAAFLLVPLLAFAVFPASSFGLALAVFFASGIALAVVWHASIRCPSCRAFIHLHRKGPIYGPHVPSACPACGKPINSAHAA
jgi:hypothetical protein